MSRSRKGMCILYVCVCAHSNIINVYLICPALEGQIVFENLALRAGQKGRAK